MSNAYFIAIGGTGAKTLEAFIHLCAAGLGPDKVWIGLIDQDIENGHVAQVSRVLQEYNEARSHLRPPGRNLLGDDCRLFHTQFEWASEEEPNGYKWQPLSRRKASLADCIFEVDNLEEDERQLIDCLFTADEQNQELDWGFRGRPALGAATFARVTRDADFWKQLLASIQGETKGTQDGSKRCAVFMAGSVYGRTGAAGFPILSRLLRTDSGDEVSEKLHLGGALLLPYFRFEPVDSSDGMAADSSAFLEQSAKALEYYHQLLKADRVFDELFLVGWNPLLSMPSPPKIGGKDQRNPPMVPEIYAALGGCHFLRKEVTGNTSGKANAKPAAVDIRYATRADGDKISWQDLPSVASKSDHYTALGNLIRFSHLYSNVYAPRLIGDVSDGLLGEPWVKHSITEADVNLADLSVQTALICIRQYCQTFLTWICDLDLAMEHGDFNLTMAAINHFAEPTAQNHAPWSTLKSPPDAEKQLKDFGQLISPYLHSSSRRLDPGADHVLKQLGAPRLGFFGKRKGSARAGLGEFFGTLWLGCKV